MKRTNRIKVEENTSCEVAEGSSDIDIRIAKYGDSRFFAIWLNEELLAVTVYKKGAIAIRDLLMRR